jgi:hypothetical protein
MKLLEYGTCVQECPSDTGEVICYETQYQKDESDYYDDCQYYIGGKSNGVAFRYKTK